MIEAAASSGEGAARTARPMTNLSAPARRACVGVATLLWSSVPVPASLMPGTTVRRPGATALVSCGRRQLAVPYRDMFGAVASGDLVAYADSAGHVSIAVNGGDAAQRLGLRPGARVSIAAVPR